MLSRFHAITRPKAGEEGGRKIRAIIFTLSLSLFFHRSSSQFRFLTRENRIDILFIYLFYCHIFLRRIYILLERKDLLPSMKWPRVIDRLSYRGLYYISRILFFCSRRLPVRGQIARVVRELKIHKRKLQVNKRKAGSTRRFDQRLIFA